MARLLIENPALLVVRSDLMSAEKSVVRLGDELPRRPGRISCLNIPSIGLAKAGRAHSIARSQRQFRKDVTCNTFPSEAYDLDVAETFEKSLSDCERFPEVCHSSDWNMLQHR